MDRLSGSIHPKEFHCYSKDGAKADATEAIFPIIKQDISSKKYFFIGTGFFITNEGVIMTAKHVLQDVIDGNVATGPIGICHFLPGNQYKLRSIVKGFWRKDSDIAVALLDQPRHNKTNQTLKNKSLQLTSFPCHRGDSVFTYAYPASDVVHLDKSQKMMLAPEYFSGVLEKEYPRGVDYEILPNPCWRTSIHVHAGASGGPVFNSDGRVIGMNSASYKNHPGRSFVSTVKHILKLDLSGMITNTCHKKGLTLGELLGVG